MMSDIFSMTGNFNHHNYVNSMTTPRNQDLS